MLAALAPTLDEVIAVAATEAFVTLADHIQRPRTRVTASMPDIHASIRSGGLNG